MTLREDAKGVIDVCSPEPPAERTLSLTTAAASLPHPCANTASPGAAEPSNRPEARESSKAASSGRGRPVADFAGPVTTFAERQLFHELKLKRLGNRALLEDLDWNAMAAAFNMCVDSQLSQAMSLSPDKALRFKQGFHLKQYDDQIVKAQLARQGPAATEQVKLQEKAALTTHSAPALHSGSITMQVLTPPPSPRFSGCCPRLAPDSMSHFEGADQVLKSKFQTLCASMCRRLFPPNIFGPQHMVALRSWMPLFTSSPPLWD